MARCDFYHLIQTPLEDALAQLLRKVLQAEQRAVVLAPSDDQAEALTEALWRVGGRDDWLPHGNHKDGFAADQPIWLTASPEDCPNGASMLFLTGGSDSPLVESMARVFDLFDGHDENAVQSARLRYRARLNAGHSLHYWQKSADGRWVEKARSEK